ncbi:MAG: CPBP family intramembrane glutamic endopeptidase [Armatimonadota bacterium]|nr:CPBP family intramembrane glutamic endopeptidase [Armatimonadota bacterium]
MIELVMRGGVGGALAVALIHDEERLFGTIGLVESIALWLAMLVLGAFFLRKARRQHLQPADLGYRISRVAVLIGLASGAAILGLVGAASEIDQRLFDQSRALEFRRSLSEAGLVNAVILIPANGVLTPIVEEFAWRGYIQRRLIVAWGAPGGILVTSLLFAGKHVVVDLWLGRTVVLILGSLALGVVGARWGTLASTVAHLSANLSATVLALREAGVL